MDGFETSMNIREIEKEKNIPKTTIIALTANTFQNDNEKYVSSCFDFHLKKPVNISEVTKIIENIAKEI